jgi:uncharacterized protein
MPGYFLDTSALVKRYVEEPGSDVVTGICDHSLRHDIVIASIAEVELTSAVRRRVREGTFPVDDADKVYGWFKEDLVQQYAVRMLDAAVISTAVELLTLYPLRAYDAVQLASSLVASRARTDAKLPPLVFVAADRDLADIAMAAGMQTIHVGRVG